MKATIETLINAVIHDNRDVIHDYGTVKKYFMSDIEARGSDAYLWFLSDEEIEAFEKDSEERERLINEIHSFLDNYDYNPLENELEGLSYHEVVEVLEDNDFTCTGKVERMYDDFNVNDTICEMWEKGNTKFEVSPLHEYGDRGECWTLTTADNKTIFEAYAEDFEGQDIRLN